MATKELTLKESTYEQLRQSTRDDERPADVVRRLLDTHEIDGGTAGDAEAAQLAESALTIDDLQAIDNRGTDPVEYLATEHGVDVTEYDTALELREAIHGAGGRPAAARPGTESDRDTATGTARDAGTTDGTGRGAGTATDGGASAREQLGGQSDSRSPDPETEQLAESALTIGDLQAADNQELSATEYLEREYDVDASRHHDEASLLDAVRRSGGMGR